MRSAGTDRWRTVAIGGGLVEWVWPVGRVVVTLPSGSGLARQRGASFA